MISFLSPFLSLFPFKQNKSKKSNRLTSPPSAADPLHENVRTESSAFTLPLCLLGTFSISIARTRGRVALAEAMRRRWTAMTAAVAAAVIGTPAAEAERSPLLPASLSFPLFVGRRASSTSSPTSTARVSSDRCSLPPCLRARLPASTEAAATPSGAAVPTKLPATGLKSQACRKKSEKNLSVMPDARAPMRSERVMRAATTAPSGQVEGEKSLILSSAAACCCCC